MALVKCVRVRGDVEHASMTGALARLAVVAARLGAGISGHGFVAHNRRDAEALFDLAKAHLRRQPLTAGAVSVQRHNCPHVPGYEESSYGPCNNAEYGYVEEAI